MRKVDKGGSPKSAPKGKKSASVKQDAPGGKTATVGKGKKGKC